VDLDTLVAFVAVLIRSGAVLLPATLGAIVTEQSGATNLGVEGVMLFGAMAGYGVAYQTGNPWLGLAGGAVAGGVLCLPHAVSLVRVRVGMEQQFVLGLILVYLGDALSRLLGRPFVNQRTPGIDERFVVPVLGNIPYLGEALFQQRTFVYVCYILAFITWFVLFKTRLGLHLRAVGEDPATADSLGVPVERYRFGAIVVGGMLMGIAGAVLSLSVIGAWTEGLTGGRGWIALGLVTFAGWHPLWAIGGTLLFGGFEAAQFRLPAPFPGAQYLLGIFPYLAPIISLPLIAWRLKGRSIGAPASLGQPYFRERRG
jgi:simple sugar transport system permease protein